jgi:putative heme-binding domain-containing protein
MSHRLILATLLAPTLPLAAFPDGAVVTRFAGPPEVEYPTGISSAANGDVYVSVDKNGSLGKEADFGKIVIARDTDADGKADAFIDFVPVLSSPRGGHFTGGTFYVVHPPYLSAFRDTTGDGVADEHKVLVKGFGWGIEHPRGADHTTNGVRMGIDGWLYVGVGDFGMPDAVGADGTRLTLHGGGVVRVRPDGSEMEVYAAMTRNHFAPAISPLMDMFVRDNTNDGKGWNTRLHHFTAMGDHGYPRLYQNFADETVLPLADYGGGSGTGGAYIHEPGLPEAFADTLFTCDWTTGHIYHHPLQASEATFTADQQVFTKLPRAIDIDVDGFSHIYVCDWRNGQYKYAGPKVEVGMVQQVSFPGLESAKYQDVARATAAQLPPLLRSRSAVQRLEAQQEILRRGDKDGIANGVLDVARDGKAPVYSRVAAIFTYKQLVGKKATPALAALTRDDAVREFALRAMTDRLTELDGVPVKPYLEGLRDANPRVRLQAAIGLGRLRDAATASALLEAAATWTSSDAAHPRLPHTAVKALARIGNVQACLDAVAIPAQRPIALRALQEIHGPATVDGLISKLDATTDPALSEAVMGALARLAHVEAPWDLKAWWSTRPDDRGPYFAPVEWERSPAIREAIERNFSKLPDDRHGAAIDTFAKNRLAIGSLKLGNIDPLTSALAAKTPSAHQQQLFHAAAGDTKRPWDQRIASYRRIAEGRDESATLARLQILAQWKGESGAPDFAAQALSDFINSPERAGEIDRLRQHAAREKDAASRIAWMALLTIRQSPLADAKAKQKVADHIAKNPREPGFFLALAEMKLAGFDAQIDAAINSDNAQLVAAAKAAREAAGKQSTDARKVADLAPADVLAHAMAQRGDPALGQRIYTAQGCIACHSVDPAAEQKGPYLGNAGSQFTRDYLIESITDPNKVIAQGFQTAMFRMKDNAAHVGFVTGETDGIIELRDIAGLTTRIERASVADQQFLPTSIMPPGLANTLTLDEFTALIDYMVSLKAEAK